MRALHWDDAPAPTRNRWLTTADAGRLLQLTVEGVRWLARTKQLVGERAVSGQWFFREWDVVRLAERRAKARIGIRAVRPSTGAIDQARQLAMFTGWQMRLVRPKGERSLPDRVAKIAKCPNKRAGVR
jgi:hypothetical protein